MRLFYDYNDAPALSAVEAMRELSYRLGFNIIGSTPQGLFGGWEFEIDKDIDPADLPAFVRDISAR